MTVAMTSSTRAAPTTYSSTTPKRRAATSTAAAPTRSAQPWWVSIVEPTYLAVGTGTAASTSWTTVRASAPCS